MKATELRIGNWVFFDSDSFGSKVTLETFAILSKYPLTISSIKPIPLTHEILLKAGFEKSNENEYNYNQIFIKFLEYDKIQFCNPTVYGGVIKCQYVHQLQNLYFSLTGEELEITL